jgi:hypothetical protein
MIWVEITSQDHNGRYTHFVATHQVYIFDHHIGITTPTGEELWVAKGDIVALKFYDETEAKLRLKRYFANWLEKGGDNG